MDNITSFNIILSAPGVSHCSYEPLFGATAPSRLVMPIPFFKEILDYAVKRGCHLNLLAGEEPLDEYLTLARESGVSCLLVVGPRHVLPGATVVAGSKIEVEREHWFHSCPPDQERIPHLIVRFRPSQLDSLTEFLSQAVQCAGRISLFMTDLSSFTGEDFIKYKEQLHRFSLLVATNALGVPSVECNILTDRLVLTNPNHCDSGVTHLTVAPSGDMYLCPGFFYENPGDSLGRFPEWDIINSHLLSLAYAPLCAVCDAYQCRRCVLLNRKTTGEYNVPPREACVLAHLERNASAEIAAADRFRGQFSPVIPVDYLDPFQITPEGGGMGSDEFIEHVVQLLGAPLAHLDAFEILKLAYRVDPMIIHKIKNLRDDFHD
ncbi:CXXX repeat peptide maturase [Myxococcota bacterium]|nr:CXXX repeat peptide maturase [Myxococcota bacterium]